MATTTYNSFEGGTAATAITGGNSGGASGNAYSVVLSGAPTLEYAAAAMHGSLCAHYVGSSGNTGYLRREHTSTDTSFARTFYFKWNSAVTPSITFLQLRDNAGSPAVKFQALTNGSSRLQLSDAGGTNLIFTGVTLTAGRWYRLEVQGTVGSTTSNGVLNAQLFGGTTTQSDADGTSALQSLSSSTANLGTTPPGHWRFFGAAGGDLYIDDDKLTTDTTTVAPLGPYAAPTNAPPTVSAGATQTITSGSFASVVFTADDSDGTIASWQTPTVTTTADTAPTVGTPTLAGIGTNHSTATYPVTGLTPSDTTVSTRPLDNSGAPAAALVGARVIYTSTNPLAKAVTLVGCTMTSPSSGTPKDAWNAWLGNPYDADTNPSGIQPPVFTTAGPPASNATVTVDYQPLDAANVPPSFSQSWALTPDTTTPVTVFVDLRFSGATKATASLTLSSTTPVPVGKVCTGSENTAIGSGQLSRVAPSVVGRFA